MAISYFRHRINANHPTIFIYGLKTRNKFLKISSLKKQLFQVSNVIILQK